MVWHALHQIELEVVAFCAQLVQGSKDQVGAFHAAMAGGMADVRSGATGRGQNGLPYGQW